MRAWNLSTKVVVAYSLLIALTSGALTVGLYWQLRNSQLKAIRDRLLEIVSLAIPQIDSDYHALIVTPEDAEQAYYNINYKRLQNIQSTSEAINRIYTLRQQKNGQFTFVLYYDHVRTKSALIGEVFQPLPPILKGGLTTIIKPVVEPNIIKNSEGKPILYGYAPIKDLFGRSDAILVIELDAISVVQSEIQAGVIALVTFFIILIFTLVVVWWLARSLVVHPVIQLNIAAKQLADGKWEQTLRSDRSDELGELAKSFNYMASQLQTSFRQLEEHSQTLEEKVAQRTNELEQAKEMADRANNAKSEFLAAMSHELRTPLNGILGYAQILQRDEPLTENGRRGIQIIYDCGSHLLTLINDVLDLAKIESGKMELHPIDFYFPSFLEGVVDICKIRAKQKAIAFNYQPDENLPSGIKCDEKRLRQVLLNLLGNAIKFTDNGYVNFKVKLIQDESLETEENLSNCSLPIYKIRFEVEDTGVGITAEEQEKIFLPFEQVGDTYKQAEGTGLGLAISLNIISLLDSKIEVISESGKGSTFWFEAEFYEAKNWAFASKISPKGTIIGYQGNRRKLLVIDDRWENRSVMVNLLQPIGFDIEEANNGQEGLKMALNYLPDLIITDLVMPIMDGFELMKELRKSPELEDVIILASSASIFESHQYKSYNAGANAFLPKPIQAEQILELLRKYLNLDWIYEEKNQKLNLSQSKQIGLSQADQTIIKQEENFTPSLDVLEYLYQLAKKGDVYKIIEEAARINEINASFLPFTERLVELASTFQLQAIRAFIKQYLVKD
jgi:signal transduction histidine kinase/DNA-binding response OmpR family regulator